MKRRSELVTLAVCVGVIVVAFLLFSYGKKYDVRSIGFFGYVLDPLITTGVVGNFILFILIKATKLNPLRTALWTFAIIHAGFLAFSVLVIGRLFPMFNLPAVTVGYLVSFAIWAGLHFAMRHRPRVYS